MKKGFRFSEEARQKKSESMRGFTNSGSFKKGNKLSEETKKKMSAARKGVPRKVVRFGSESPNWKGGISTDWCRYARIRRMRRYGGGRKHLSKAEWGQLKNATNHTCVSCYKTAPEIQLHADHIMPLALGGSDTIENIQPLCKSCNSRKRTKLINYITTYGLFA